MRDAFDMGILVTAICDT